MGSEMCIRDRYPRSATIDTRVHPWMPEHTCRASPSHLQGMKAAQGRACVVDIGQQYSCRYPPARPKSKRVHDGDPDAPPVATPTVASPAIPAAAALPMRQGAEARVQAPTMHWPPAPPAAPTTLAAGAPAMHPPPAPPAATQNPQLRRGLRGFTGYRRLLPLQHERHRRWGLWRGLRCTGHWWRLLSRCRPRHCRRYPRPLLCQ